MGSGRPQGVSFLTMLEGLLAAISLFSGLASLWLATAISDPEIILALQEVLPPEFMDSAFTIFAFLGILGLVHSGVNAILAYGFWKGRRWSWKLGLAFSMYSVAASLLTYIVVGEAVSTIFDVIFTLAISTLIIYNLTRPQMKQYFFGGSA
jgi:hypothetical protein